MTQFAVLERALAERFSPNHIESVSMPSISAPIHLPIRLGKVRSLPDGSLVLNGIASDDRPDIYRTRMDVRLFHNFIRRAAPPNPPPYLSVAHYTTPIGAIQDMVVDGRYLKFRAVLPPNPITEELRKSLADPALRVRTGFSIGFNDLDSYTDETAGNLLVYIDGELAHVALTTIPANPRSRLLSVEMRARTQMADAEELVGATFAGWLDAQESKPPIMS
jgi:hypothetical protein